MRKSKILIGSGSVFLITFVLLGIQIPDRLSSVFDGDSVIPDIIGVLSAFTLRDYLFAALLAGLFFIGLSLLIVGIVLLISKENRIQKAYQ
jgi:hypothetical protein